MLHELRVLWSEITAWTKYVHKMKCVIDKILCGKENIV